MIGEKSLMRIGKLGIVDGKWGTTHHSKQLQSTIIEVLTNCLPSADLDHPVEHSA